MKKKTKAAIIATAAASTAFCAGNFGLAHYIMDTKGLSTDESLEQQKAFYDTGFFKEVDRTTFFVKSWDGYRIHAELCRDLKQNADSKKYVILSHGYNDTRFGCLKYVKMYLELGYHCVIYDLRGWGDNERDFCTFGIRESRDLACVIDECHQRFGNDIILGLHGESMGASVSIFALKYRQVVDFVVSDCGYAEFWPILKRIIHNKIHLPGFLCFPVSYATQIRYGYSFRQMKPIDSLAHNKVPILYLHGSKDQYILPENSWKMYKATKSYREFHLIPSAGHAQSILADPDRYYALVRLFLKKIGC